jgi:hypothetical protein
MKQRNGGANRHLYLEDSFSDLTCSVGLSVMTVLLPGGVGQV